MLFGEVSRKAGQPMQKRKPADVLANLKRIDTLRGSSALRVSSDRRSSPRLPAQRLRRHSIYYDVVGGTVEIMAILGRQDADEWL